MLYFQPHLIREVTVGYGVIEEFPCLKINTASGIVSQFEKKGSNSKFQIISI